MTRKVTEQILEDIEHGILDKDVVIMSCLKYMSKTKLLTWHTLTSFFLQTKTRMKTTKMMDSLVGNKSGQTLGRNTNAETCLL